ncbi:hypothetical protein D5S18_07760 [Nocardia panacis]|uniref:Aminoacyl-transfer RNA synthetases class-II family profile domain-containing protein n=1 Tax=Nocardia panacis TaxID=2340916 RepID=A0A3A4KVU2_9NOCA|nr:amino acid--tRNA ligase-related protein [Nocardia panacis]RJO77624.1 hypothetical protein D5S18_07760 [Nocardia panacis]
MNALGPSTEVATVGEAIGYKSELLWRIRTLLRGLGFAEVVTPVFRQADDLTGLRPPAEVGGRGFLRSMIGPALRYNLQHTPRVYEIGACFRPDQPDPTHSREFSMLDLYAADESFEFLIALAERLVHLAYPGPLPRISVAEHLTATLGVDLVSETLDAHTGALAQHLHLPKNTPLRDLLDAYIRAELEPRTLGSAATLTDMPLGGNEPCAQRRRGTAAVLNRFEVFINGLEVVHGYEDETDTDEFVTRARGVGLFNPEQQRIVDAVRDGTVPAHSVGLGIGIERLCMAATGVADIAQFRQSACF